MRLVGREYHLIFRRCCSPRELGSAVAIDAMRSSLHEALRERGQGKLIDLRIEKNGQVHVRFVGSRALEPMEALTTASRWLGRYLDLE